MEHDHKYNSYYVCEYCGMVDYTTLASLATTEESNAAGSFGQTADWWQSPSAYLTKSGDFLLKFTFSCGTCNGNTAAFEMLLSDTTDWNDGYFDYNPNDGNIWGGIVNATQNIGLDATKAPATYKTTEDGAKPAYGTDVTYVVYAYRIGANFVMSYQMLKAEQIVYTLTLVSENFATGDIQVHISGYNTGMTDFKAYTGTISAKA